MLCGQVSCVVCDVMWCLVLCGLVSCLMCVVVLSTVWSCMSRVVCDVVLSTVRSCLSRVISDVVFSTVRSCLSCVVCGVVLSTVRSCMSCVVCDVVLSTVRSCVSCVFGVALYSCWAAPAPHQLRRTLVSKRSDMMRAIIIIIIHNHLQVFIFHQWLFVRAGDEDFGDHVLSSLKHTETL